MFNFELQTRILLHLKAICHILYCLCVIVLFSCKQDQKETIAYTSELVSQKANSVEVNSQFNKAIQGFKIAGLAVDTLLSNNTNCQEIRVSFEAAVAEEILTIATNSGFNAIYLNSYLLENSIKHGESRITLLKSRTEQTTLTSGLAFDRPDKRQYEIDFPFRNLLLKKGERSLQFIVEVYGAVFRKDSTSATAGYFEKLSPTPLAIHTGEFKINAPQLYEFKIKISQLELDTSVVNPAEFDVRYLGPGYPDLCWMVKVSNEIVYTSPVMDNAIIYTRKGQTKSLVSTAHDYISLSVVDFDDTSEHDMIEEIGNMFYVFQQNPKVDKPIGNLKKISYHFESKPIN